MMRTPATIASTAITSGGKPSGTRPETPTTIRYIARTVIPMLRLNLNAIAPPEDETIQETPRRHNRTECDARAIRALYVFKNIVNPYDTTNVARPRSAYNIPLTRRDPGPDGVLGTADDGQSVKRTDQYQPQVGPHVCL